MDNISIANAGSYLPVINVICSRTFAVLVPIGVSVQVWTYRQASQRLDIGGILDTLAASIATALVVQVTWSVIVEGKGTLTDGKPSNQQAILAKYLMDNELLWGLATTITCWSDPDLTRSLFAHIRWYGWATHQTIFFGAAYLNVLTLESSLMCRSTTTDWKSDITGICVNQIASYIALKGVGLLMIDLIIGTLPLCVVAAVQRMTLRKGSAMYAMYLWGFMLTVFGAFRMHAIRNPGFIHSNSYLGISSSLGAFTGIVTFSVTPLLSLLNKIRRRQIDQSEELRKSSPSRVDAKPTDDSGSRTEIGTSQ